MSFDPGVSSSLRGLVPEKDRTLDWALASGFPPIVEWRTQDVVSGHVPARIEGCPGDSNVVEDSSETAWSYLARSRSYSSSRYPTEGSSW